MSNVLQSTVCSFRGQYNIAFDDSYSPENFKSWGLGSHSKNV